MKSIPKLKSSFLSRQFGLAKLAFDSRKTIFNETLDLGQKLREGLGSQAEKIVHEMGLMKGSVMKAGQMLGQYAGPYLPAEAQAFIKALENQSYYLEWDSIAKRIPAEWQRDLEIDPTPIAAASLGQVHRAVHKKTGEVYAMKIQYEGVAKAIDNDLRALKLLLKGLKLLPKDIDLSDVFAEIKSMLKQETDYLREAEQTEFFYEHAKHFVVPKVIREYCNDHILTATFVEGAHVREANLTQAERDRLGEEMLRLFFQELYDWGRVQSDAHLGNFMLAQSQEGARWVLLDFGAVKVLSPEAKKDYQEMMSTLIKGERERYFAVLEKLGILTPDLDKEQFWAYAQLFATPFNGGIYDWGSSDIPDQAMKGGMQMLASVKSLKPPGENIFVDRKVGGVFFILKTLGARFDARKVVDEFIHRSALK